MRFAFYLGMGFIFLGSLGCARVQVYPVENAYGSQGRVVSADSPGVRFFRPAPHVWITSAPPSDKVNVSVVERKTETKTEKTTRSIAPKGYAARLLMLPDYSQEYVISWRTGLGTVQPGFTLEGGWNLIRFSSEANVQGAALLEQVVSAATSLTALATGELLAGTSNFKGAGLYRLEVDGKGRFTLGDLVFGLE